MTNYYCPYCRSTFNGIKKGKNEHSLCFVCGEELVNKPYISFIQILAIVVVLGIASPLFALLVGLITENEINPAKREQPDLSLSLNMVNENKFF